MAMVCFLDTNNVDKKRDSLRRVAFDVDTGVCTECTLPGQEVGAGVTQAGVSCG